MDIDSLLWSRKLFIAGAILSLFWITVNKLPYHLKDVGVLLIFSGLLFLIDVRANKKFKSLFWIVLGIWTLNLLGSIASFVQLSDSFQKVTTLIDLIIMFGVPLSIILFCKAMFELAAAHQLAISASSWRHSAKLCTYVYGIPVLVFFVGFLAVVLGQIEALSFYFKLKEGATLIDFLKALPIIALFFWPLVHLFISYSRMIAEVKKVAASPTPM